MGLGQKLKNLRSQKNLTLDNLVDRLNKRSDIKFSKGKISKWENDKEEPRLSSLKVLADFYGVDIDYFLSDNDDHIDSIYETFSSLSEHRKKSVREYAQKQLDSQQTKDKTTLFRETDATYDFPFKGAVSAGTGEWLYGEINEIITLNHTPPANADFALKVNGDSMEPFFENGQIIFVKTVEDPSQVFSNQFVIADLNGEAYLKKIVFEQVGCRLVSLNKKYPDKVVTENDAFYVRGTVVFE